MNTVKDNANDTIQSPVPQVRPLFRRQVIEFSNTNHYGAVILQGYVSHRIMTIGFLLVTVAILAFFIFFTTAHKAQVSGILLPSNGLIRVRSGQSGIVKQIRIKEGQKVQAGDILFILSNERNIGTSQSAEGVTSTLLQSRRDSYYVELLQINRQSIQRASATKRRAIALGEEGRRLDSQIMLQRSRVTLVLNAYKRFENLHTTNYISSAQVEDKEGELLDQQQRLAELERLKGNNQREYAATEAEYLDLRVQAQRDEIALKRNALAIQQDIAESEARREIKVLAPTNGTVTTIMVEVGKSASSDTALTSILPVGSELAAEIYAPSRSIGFIKPGMKVLLRYHAYPYQKFGQYEATVTEVSGISMPAQEMTAAGIAMSSTQEEPLYRIRLKLKQQSILAYDNPIKLKPGMLLDASVVLEHRRLYEWILEPLFSISGRG